LVRLVVDSSFLMAVVEKPTTWIEDATDLIGSVEPILLRCVEDELKRLSSGKGRRARWAALALDLAAGFENRPTGAGDVDSEIISFAAGHEAAVATIDRNLVAALKARGVVVLGLRRGRAAVL
jgi:rRNA-processing protein FCF1